MTNLILCRNKLFKIFNFITWIILLKNLFFLDKMALEILAQEKVWLDKSKYADAERMFYEKQSKVIDIF